MFRLLRMSYGGDSEEENGEGVRGFMSKRIRKSVLV